MRRVELHTFQIAKKKKGYGIRHGFVCTGVIPCGGYARLSATARRLSKHIGEDMVNGLIYEEKADREKGLAAVCVITYEHDEERTSEKWEFFEDGKFSYTIKEVWRKGGGYTKNFRKAIED